MKKDCNVIYDMERFLAGITKKKQPSLVHADILILVIKMIEKTSLKSSVIKIFFKIKAYWLTVTNSLKTDLITRYGRKADSGRIWYRFTFRLQSGQWRWLCYSSSVTSLSKVS